MFNVHFLNITMKHNWKLVLILLVCSAMPLGKAGWDVWYFRTHSSAFAYISSPGRFSESPPFERLALITT